MGSAYRIVGRGSRWRDKGQIVMLRTYLLSLALLAVGCDPPTSCVMSKEVGDWSIVEHSPDATTKPILSCGRVVGYEVTMSGGLHASTLWRLEKAFPGEIGESVKFSLTFDAAGPAAEQLRPSIEEIDTRTEIGFINFRPALAGTATISPRTSPSPGVVRAVNLHMSVFGPGTWLLRDFAW